MFYVLRFVDSSLACSLHIRFNSAATERVQLNIFVTELMW